MAYRDGDVTLYRVGGDAAGASPGRRALMVGAHLVWLGVLVAGAVGTVAVAARRRARPDREIRVMQRKFG